MTEVIYDDGADLGIIQGKKVAIIGYGSQGHAHAQNLRDSGVEVRVGLQPESKSRAKAQEAGFEVGTPAEVAEWADVVVLLAPDQFQRHIYNDEVAQHMTEGKTLVFSHGFNVRFGYIDALGRVDVAEADVEAAAGEEPGDAGQQTRLVLHQERQDVGAHHSSSHTGL